MAKRCPEEFNPWPPFVDIFASVILVMMLFLLITIVNIGYYAQFKYKVSYTASTITQAPIQPEDQTKIQETKKESEKTKEEEVEDSFSFHKIVAPALSENAKNSLFEGGDKEGNAVEYSVDPKKPEVTKQKLIKKDLQLSIQFQDKEIFLNSASKRKLKLFASDIYRRSKLAEFTIYASDPKKVISSTIAKQISLGRTLNIQNIIKNSTINKNKIKVNLRSEIPSTSPYGEILIRVHIP